MFVTAPDDAHDEEGDCRPKQRIEGVHGEQVRQSKQDGRHQGRQRSKKHCPATASQLACELTGKNDGRNASEGRQQPQRPERCADGVLQQPGYPSNQRRLIDVSPGRMFATCEVIELVAKVSVVRPGEEIEGDSHKGDIQDDGHPGFEDRRLPGLFCGNNRGRDCAHGIRYG